MIGVHVMKNILIPVITVLGLEFGTTIAFSVVTESIFAWPGVGKLIIDSINLLDRPVIVAYLMLIVLICSSPVNLVVDLLYTVLDPRVLLEQQRMSTSHDDRRGGKSPFRRLVLRLRAESKLATAIGFVAVCSDLDLRRVCALDFAAGPVRSGAARHHGWTACRPAPSRRSGLKFWLGTDDQGRDMLSGNPVWAAHLADSWAPGRRCWRGL